MKNRKKNSNDDVVILKNNKAESFGSSFVSQEGLMRLCFTTFETLGDKGENVKYRLPTLESNIN